MKIVLYVLKVLTLLLFLALLGSFGQFWIVFGQYLDIKMTERTALSVIINY